MSRHEFFQGMRYSLGGSMAILVHYAILFVFTEYLQMWYLASSVVAWLVGHVIGFTVHKFWTFKNREINAASKQFALFILMAIGTLVLNTTLLYALVEYIKIKYIVAQIILTLVLSTARFFITRKIFATN